ncbi:MAG: hypothetical protein Q9166_003388 [cf. Caloplaca sp. 2 TL-2023]
MPTSPQQDAEKDLFLIWRHYLESLSSDDLINFVLTDHCVQGKIRSDGAQSVINGKRPLWSSVHTEREIDAVQWLNSYLLRKGPRLLSDLWSADSSIATEAEVHVRRESRKRSAKLALLEHETHYGTVCRFNRPIEPVNVHCETTYDEALCYYMSTFYARKDPGDYRLPRVEILAQRRFETQAASMNAVGWCMDYFEENWRWRMQYRKLQKPGVPVNDVELTGFRETLEVRLVAYIHELSVSRGRLKNPEAWYGRRGRRGFIDG